jgi:hypothetical protein
MNRVLRKSIVYPNYSLKPLDACLYLIASQDSDSLVNDVSFLKFVSRWSIAPQPAFRTRPEPREFREDA